MKKKFMFQFLSTLLGVFIIISPIMILYLRIQTKNILTETKNSAIESVKKYISDYDLALFNAENSILNDYSEKMNLISTDLLKEPDLKTIPPSILRTIANKYRVNEIYLINEEGSIFNTTYIEDLNLNLMKDRPKMNEFIHNIYGKGLPFSQKALVSKNNKLNKYIYFSPQNSNFIVEISLNLKNYIETTYGNIYANYLFNDSLKTVIGENIYLTSIQIYDVTNYGGWSIFLDGSKFNDSETFLKKMNKSDELIFTNHSKSTTYNLVSNLKNSQTYFGKNLLIKLQYDFSTINNFAKSTIIFTFFCLIFLASIAFFILSDFFNYNITRRILTINQNLNQVEKGIYADNICFKENDEISEIGNNINKMKDKILERESQLKNKVLELQEKTNQLKQVQEMLAYDKLKTDFFANMSHEFKTPLNILLSSMQLIELFISNKKIEDSEKNLTKYLKIMKQNSYRLLRLINNLIDLTKIDSYFFEIFPHNYDIVKIVEEIVLSTIDYGSAKNLTIEFNKHIQQKIIACDPDKIERVILNLLSNAIKFTDKNGTITVTLSESQNKVVISVKDNGIGISRDKVGVIFERFRQADKSFTRNTEGSGIGLSLVKSLVELHNGTVSVYSEYGKGSEFIIALPVIVLNEAPLDTDQLSHADLRVEKMKVEFSDIYA